jgi:hypothetical protein
MAMTMTVIQLPDEQAAALKARAAALGLTLEAHSVMAVHVISSAFYTSQWPIQFGRAIASTHA